MARTGRDLLARVWMLAFVLVLPSGCAHWPHDRAREPASTPDAAPAATVLPEVARGRIALDLDRLAPFPALERALASGRDAVPYRGLAARSCECLAAEHSAIANLLDQKAAGCLDDGEPGRFGAREVDRSAIALRGVLLDGARAARNESAGGALELFYRLAEAEAKHDVLRQSLAELDGATAQGERMRAQGLKPGDGFDALGRQRLAALKDEIELTLAIDRLNVELRRLLALGPVGTRWRIWPEADWTVSEEAIDLPAAVALGLAQRPELATLDRLERSLDAETLPAARTVLGAANLLLGADCQGPPSALRVVLALICRQPRATDAQVAALARQLHAYRVEREQAAAAEIEQAVLTVQARLRAVAVAREARASWRKRIDELKARAERGLSTFPEDTTARLKALEAEGDLISGVMAWQIARAKLAQSQGILARECGTCTRP